LIGLDLRSVIVSDAEPTPDWLIRSPTLAEAYRPAGEAHRGQPGKDGRSPYIHHPLAVAERLAREGHDEATLAAAILHDVVERSQLGMGEVVARFGAEVGELVSALTDDGAIPGYAPAAELRGELDALEAELSRARRSADVA